MYCEFVVTDVPDIKICVVCQKVAASQKPVEELKSICKGKSSKGLGDSTAKLINTVTLGKGIKIAEMSAGLLGFEDCGCDDRIGWLNSLFPYSNNCEDGV